MSKHHQVKSHLFPLGSHEAKPSWQLTLLHAWMFATCAEAWQRLGS